MWFDFPQCRLFFLGEDGISAIANFKRELAEVING